MKVLFISHYTSLYGANRSLLNMVKLLQENHGVEPFVLMPGSGDLEGALKSRDIPYLRKNWYNWSRSKERSKYHPKEIAKRVLNMFLFRKILGQVDTVNHQFDLIHTNSSVTQIGGFLSGKLNLPHIWHLREFGEEDYNLVHDGGLKKAGRYFESYSDKIIANSHTIKKKYSQYISPELITVVHNGVSREKHEYLRDFSEINDKETLNFLFIGLINEAKNQLEALKAADVLKHDHGISKFKLYFAGSGDDAYLQRLKTFVKDRDLEQNVKFLGYVQDIHELKREMDIALVCSKQEAFGRVTVEAMLGQMPVIATNSGGTPEIIDHGETGFLYELGNYDKLASYMKKLIKDREQIAHLAKNGYEKARQKFTAKVNAQNIYKNYKSVLKG